MTESILKLSEAKAALKRGKFNYKIQTSELNGTEKSVTFIDACTKAKLRGKIIQSFNEGEVYHWPLLHHENVARLIDILHIRDNLYIYFTVSHEITLKNTVHDKNFVYDAKCFDRKLLYAKGIFSGLGYLHGKSLCLMNLCDDNIIISETSDTAIITNFDHLTCLNKATRSKLNVPEVYMAPETENGEFDTIKAEMWASGILMLEMFLAHMVPWAIVDYKPKKVMIVVHEISLELLQAANAGSIVSEVDLAKFQIFLKCFFKEDPLKRIPAKYAAIASFLQRRPQNKEFKDTYQSVGFMEDVLPLDYSNLKLPEEDSTFCLNPSYDPSSNFLSPIAQKRDITNRDITPDVSTVTTQQAKGTKMIGGSKQEVDLTLKGTSEMNIWPQKEEILKGPFLPLSCETGGSLVDAESTGDFQKTTNICEAAGTDAATEPSYDCHQSESLSPVKPRINGDNAVTFKLCAKKCVYSNCKLTSTKQFAESDLGNCYLCSNRSLSNYENNPVVKFDSNADNNYPESNPPVESDWINVDNNKKFSELIEKRHMWNESHVKEPFPNEGEYSTSVRTLEKTFAKSPRYLRAPHLSFINPEIKSVIDKIIFLRKCYISIKTHQRVFISLEFARRQQKFIKEYQILIRQENLRLHEMLTKKYELKLKDIAKLIGYANLRALTNGHQFTNLWMTQNFCEIYGNKLLQALGTKGAMKGDKRDVKYCPEKDSKHANALTAGPNRNDSYCRAIENSDTDTGRKFEINSQQANEKFKKDWEIADFVPNRDVHQNNVAVRNKNYEVTEDNNADIKMNETVKQYEQGEDPVKSVRNVTNDRGAISKKAMKKEEIDVKKKIEKNPKKLDNKNKKINVKSDKKEKKLSAPKKPEETKKSRFLSMCLGVKVEEQSSYADTLCEKCKFNLDFT